MTDAAQDQTIGEGFEPRADAYRVTVKADMRLREGTWDGGRGRREVFEWATDADGEVDLAKAAQGHVVADLGEGTRAALKMPVAYVEDGSLVGIGNALRNALARLSQVDGLSDGVRGQARDILEGMLARLNEQTSDALVAVGFSADTAAGIVARADASRRRLADVERSEQEQADIREKFPRLINMTPSEMREWSESPFAGENRKEGEAAASAREALRDVIRLKEKPMSEWTEADYDDAVEAIAFVERMSEVEQGEPLVVEGREGPSARDASLKDWGHNPGTADQGEQLEIDGTREDRRWRWSRLSLVLDDKQSSAVARALSAANVTGERSDATTIKAVAEQLRADGLGDYLTGEGFLRLKVRAARTGTQFYSDGQSTWGEYRSAEEVGDGDSLDSWGLKPFTDDHPRALVVPKNYTSLAKGSVGQDAQLTDPAEDGNRYIEVTILVGDLATLEKISRGKLELSAGYTAVMVEDQGVDENGARYEYRQTKIRINHLALVEAGRAGPLAAIKVDGGAWEIEPRSDAREDMQPMKISDGTYTDMCGLMHKAYNVGDGMRSDMEASPEAIAAVMEMLAQLAQAAMAGEEMNEDMLGEFARMTDMSPQEASDMCGRPDMENQMEMIDVEVADGITVSMPKDKADALAKIKADEEAKIKADEAGRSDLESRYADTAGRLAAVEAELAKTSAHVDATNREMVTRTIADVCPDLAAKWAPKGRGQRYADDVESITDMKIAAILDLDPSFEAELASARKDFGDKLDRFVDPIFDREIRTAAKRRADQTPTYEDRRDNGGLNNRISSAVYGV